MCSMFRQSARLSHCGAAVFPPYLPQVAKQFPLLFEKNSSAAINGTAVRNYPFTKLCRQLIAAVFESAKTA